MKVLILSQYYAPEPAFKMPDLARALIKKGHEVEVLTGFPCYPIGKTYEGYCQGWPTAETEEGVTVRRIPQFADHSRSAVRRALYYLSFAISAAFFGTFLVKRADVLLVYQSAMPTGLAGRWLSFCRRMPMVLDVVDLWPESVTASGMMRRPSAVWLIERSIRFVYRGATRVNVITNGYWRSLQAKGVPEQVLSLIHCWPASGKFDPVPRDACLEEEINLNAGNFVVTYAGAIGPVQDLRVVLDTAEQLAGERDVQFYLAGDGVEASRLADEVNDRGITSVRFLGRLSPEKTQKLYASSDLLLAHLKPDPVSDVSIPSKTFAYMASGKPLLMAVAGEASELVRKHRCGVVAEPGDPLALATALRDFRRLGISTRQKMGTAARRAYLENYCSEVQVAKFEALLYETAGIARPAESSEKLAA